MKKIILLLCSIFILFAAFHKKETITITGQIKDGNGVAVPYVTVTAGGVHVTADSGGTYKIVADENEKYLSFTGVGYETQKVKINKRKIVNVIMKPVSSELTAMVVPGYSAAKAKMLQGKVSGLYITGTSPAGYPRNNLQDEEYNTEEYDNIVENGFHKVSDDPLSTFSIDVDAASYSNVRRYL
ncbi:MAG: von Willebrand factor type A domain-containing protein, partial [Bacteroidota bacterium]|nr:von Willebrand factor type A domain-containing protein [Bacteroidota bacterium]